MYMEGFLFHNEWVIIYLFIPTTTEPANQNYDQTIRKRSHLLVNYLRRDVVYVKKLSETY